MVEKELTSFIPKQTLTKPVYQKRGPGFLLLFSIFLFVVSLGILFGAYFYKKSLDEKVKRLTDDLKKAQEVLDQNFLTEIKKLDEQIENAKVLLNQHALITPLFDLFENSTLKSIKFNNLSFHLPASTKSETSATLAGVAKSFSSLALQIEELQKNEAIRSVSASGLSLSEDGKVNFAMQINFNPSYFRNK